MRYLPLLTGILAASAVTLTAPDAVTGQGVDPVHAHIGHVATAFRGTPDGIGLLPAAVAEAEVAHQHATLAGRDPTDLEGMQRHMAHVIHALDPSEVESGPGAGYGVIAAARNGAHHIKLAAASDGASDGVKTHATHVATAAIHAMTMAEEAIDLAEDIQKAEDAAAAAEMLAELTALTDAILNGMDADGDGRVGWQEEEGGLAQATTHLGLLMRGEGLGG